MKLSKKVLAAFSAAAMLVVAGTFVACADDEESAFSGKKVDFDNSYVTTTTATDGTVTVKNAKSTDTNAVENSNYYYRAFKKLATKHYGSTCVITLTPQNDGKAYSSTNAANGVAGFVFNLTKNTTDTSAYDFDIAAIQYDGSKIRTYVSKYVNAALKDNNFTTAKNFTQSDGTTTSTEEEILKGSSSAYFDFTADDFTKDTATGAITVVVKVTANDDGGYSIDYYNSLENAQAGTGSKKTATVTAVKTGYTQKTQTEMAMYANIYPGQHMVSEFAFKDTVGNDLPFEDEVVEY